MRHYEMMVILDAGIETHSEEIAKVEEVIKNLGGNVTKTDQLGKKTLAYPINKKTEGFYTVFYFDLDAAQTFELRRILGLRQNIYRQLMLVQDD